MSEAKSIISEIRIAFAGVQRGRITLHEADEIDNYSTEDICKRARLNDQDMNWEEVPDEHIFRCYCSLIYLDYASWRYYIPAFMIFTLKYFDPTPQPFREGYHSSASFDSTVASLCGMFLEQRHLTLNEKQLEAARRLLQYMAEMNNDYWIKDTLQRYWSHNGPASLKNGVIP